MAIQVAADTHAGKLHDKRTAVSGKITSFQDLISFIRN